MDFSNYGQLMITELNPSCAELGPAQPQLVYTALLIGVSDYAKELSE